MQDIQSMEDQRNVPLERVGISKLKLPIMILQQIGGYQHVTADIAMGVEVPATVRGAHMSRFVEVLHEWADRPVASSDIESLLGDVRARAGSVSAETTIAFHYFLTRAAPVSRKEGFVDYGCEFLGRLDADGFRFRLRVRVPVTTVCPCSKAISDQGAHNQRAIVDLFLEPAPGEFVWLEDLISVIEAEASCPVYSVLKRSDEKWVTERGYENPKFVEDVVRDVVTALSGRADIRGFGVSCESLESIHNHSAVASIKWIDSCVLPVEQPIDAVAVVG